MTEFETILPFDINSAFGSMDVKPPLKFSEKGATEMAMLTAPLVEQDGASLKEEYLQGNYAGMSFAHETLSGKTTESRIKQIEESIAASQTTEETVLAIEEGQREFSKPLSMLDYRKNYVVEQYQAPSERMPYISRTIEEDALRAEEIEKRQAAVWEDTSILGVLSDFGELILPTGVASEEFQKWDNSLDSVLERVRNAPKEQQQVVLDEMINTWLETETLILGNSNSVLIADQLDGLENAIREGGLGYIDGSLTEEQAWDRVESALNATFFATEIVGIGKVGKGALRFGKGIKGIYKFMASRIFPKEVVTSEKKRVRITFDTRGNTVPLDALTGEKPRFFYNQADAKPFKAVAEDNGLTQEELSSRLIPTPSPDTDVGYPSLDKPNELLLMDEDSLIAGNKRGKRLQKESGGTLKLDESATAIVNNAVANSIGNFKFLFTNAEDGFESVQDAERAMEYGLLGVENKQVVEKNGKWFVEVEMEHKFDPNLDTRGLNVDYENISNLNEYLFDPLRRLGEDILQGVFTLKSYNRSVAQKMQDELQSIFSKDKTVLAKAGLKPMSAEDTNGLVKALEFTDADGQDWIGSIEEFASVVNKKPEQVKGIWERYKRVESLMDNMWHIRNNKFRSLLDSQGFKVLGEGQFAKKADDFEGKSVVMDGRVVKAKDVPEGRVVMKLRNPVADGKGKMRSYVAVDPSDVKALPTKVLTQRKGHIDRFYRETGWTVKVKKARVVDDVEQSYSATSHIVKTEKEAKEIEKKLLEEGEEVEVLRARENDDLDGIYGDDESVQFGYKSSHMMQRGEVLKGSDGVNAPTAGVIESLSRTIAGVERQLDVDIVNSLRSRFLHEFKKHLRPESKGKYSGRFEDLINTKGMSTEAVEKAKQWHNYIESISKIQQGKGYAAIDRFVGKLFKYLPFDTDSQRVASIAQNFTTQMFIVGRPLFQIPQNAMQMLYVAEKYPITGLKAAAKMPSVLSALKNPTPDNLETLAKALGGDLNLAKALVQDLRENGLWDAVGMSDDFMRMVQRNSVDASATRMGNAGAYAKNFVMLPFRASKAGQEGVLKLVNLSAYMAEFQKQVLDGKRAFNAKTKNDINFNVQKITQTQNSINQFQYQNKASMLSTMFQFTQHVHKLYLDVIIDPAKKLITGEGIGESESALASSRLQAAGTLLATYAVFGPSGVFGNIVGGEIEDAIAQIDNELLKDTLQANLLNSAVNAAGNYLIGEGKLDVSSKMNPASLMDTLYEFHVQAFLEDGTVNAMGAVGAVTGQVWQTINSVIEITSAPSLDAGEKIMMSLDEIGANVAGMSDFEKTYISFHLGNYVYKSTLSGNLPVTAYEAVGALFNIPPAAIQERWQDFKGNKRSEGAAEAVAKVWVRAMHRELADAGTYEKAMEIVRKYSDIAQASVDKNDRKKVSEVFSMFKTDIQGQNTFEYIKPYINNMDMEDKVAELRSLREEAGSQQLQKEIDDAIAILTPMIEDINKVYE